MGANQVGSSSEARKELFLFLAGTFIPTIGLALYAFLSKNPAALVVITPLSMLTPAISALFVLKCVARQPILHSSALAIRWGGLRWWFLAPVLFALFVAASIGASIVLTPGLLPAPGQIANNISRLKGLPVAGLSPLTTFALAIVLSLVIGPLLNLPIFLGEELGWRGFMNPRLIGLLGRSGVLLGGLIWAAWHLPIILLGHNYPDHPLVGFFVWVPICICLNILLHAIKTRGKSIFPCALAHGAMNQIATVTMSVLFVESRFVDFLHGPAGLCGLAVVFVPAFFFYSRSHADPAPSCPVYPESPMLR